ncbi:hypothetical protein GCM10020254_71480 [Streptomyces goshikiensis]
MAGDLDGRGVLEGLPVGQYEDPVGERNGLDGVVGDDEADAAELGEVDAQGVPHTGPGGLVEGGEGLVQEQQPGPGGEGAGQGDALGLASGELGGLAVGEVADAEPVQPGLGPRAGLGARDPAGAQPVRGVGERAQVREQGAVLRDPGHPAACAGAAR